MLTLIKKYFPHLSFTIGIILLIINFIGLFVPLKNNKIYNQPSGFKDDITLSTTDALAIINQTNTYPTEQYVRKVTYALNKSVLHYWTGKHAKEYNVILPVYENYILYILTHTIFRKNALHYEFCNYKKTIERGVGLCSQVSTALSNILNDHNIHTNVIAWPQHTVTEVEIKPGTWWVVDPDYGVIIKHSMNEINNNPKIIQPFYKNKGYTEKLITKLEKSFSSKNKQVFPYDGPGYASCNTTRKYVENASYIFIWLIPIFLILPFVITKIKKRKNNEK